MWRAGILNLADFLPKCTLSLITYYDNNSTWLLMVQLRLDQSMYWHSAYTANRT